MVFFDDVLLQYVNNNVFLPLCFAVVGFTQKKQLLYSKVLQHLLSWDRAAFNMQCDAILL